MNWNEAEYALLPSLILIVVIILCKPFPLTHEVFAISPSFGYQELRNEPFNWIDMRKHIHTPFGNPSTDILAINYFSVGKTLNATVWLSAPFNKAVSRNDIILFHSSIPIARIGEPEAPTSFSGVIKSVNFSLLNLYKLHKFSITRI